MEIIKVLRFDNKYDQLFDIATEDGGKLLIHGGIEILRVTSVTMVYAKVSWENREEVKGKVNKLKRNHIVVQIIRSIYLEIEISQGYIPVVCGL
jgi:hypothetical protein